MLVFSRHNCVNDIDYASMHGYWITVELLHATAYLHKYQLFYKYCQINKRVQIRFFLYDWDYCELLMFFRIVVIILFIVLLSLHLIVLPFNSLSCLHIIRVIFCLPNQELSGAKSELQGETVGVCSF